MPLGLRLLSAERVGVGFLGSRKPVFGPMLGLWPAFLVQFHEYLTPYISPQNNCAGLISPKGYQHPSNQFGKMADGRSLAEAVAELAPAGKADGQSVAKRAAAAAAIADGTDKEGGLGGMFGLGRKNAGAGLQADRWAHPLFPRVALWLLQEVVNRRLFS